MTQDEIKESQVAAQETLKRTGGYLVAFVLLTGLTFWLLFKDQDLGEMWRVITGANVWFLLLGVALMLGHFMFEAWMTHKMLNDLGEKISYLRALKYAFLEFFFCAITPGAIGGQPVEVYYMAKEGISPAKATVTILVQTCGIQLSIMLFGLLGLIFSPQLITDQTLFLFVLGLFLNGTALLVLAVCIFAPKVTKLVVLGVLKGVEKLGLKQARKLRRNVAKGMRNYEKSAKLIKKDMRGFWMAILKVIGQTACFFLVPACVYFALGLSGETVWNLFAMQAILYVATSALPLPGAVGVSEAVFMSLYTVAFGAGMVNAATLLDRGITFYLFVLVGMVVAFITSVKLRENRRK